MSRLTIFQASTFDELQKAPGGLERLEDMGITGHILRQYFDYSNQPAPSTGYRLKEFKTDGGTASFDHQGGVTHHRLSDWRVARAETYVANTGYEAFDEVVVAYCEYSPLPDEENPWIEMAPARVTVDSFGGNEKAFEEWKHAQSVTA